MASRKKLVTLSLMVMLCVAAAPLHAQTFQDLYDFNCNTGGCIPIDYGQLTQGADGNLYGTTQGNNPGGTIFKVTPSAPAVYTDLWLFDRESPQAGLTLASDGNFYGATTDGTLFRFTPPNTLTTLHTSTGRPTAAPVEGKDGNLYGATFSGTTYRLTLPAGTFKQLSNAPGSVTSPLLLASDGNLYGTTQDGGNGNGTVFCLTTTGSITPIYKFSGSDGAAPIGPLTQGRDGYLYGTTSAGGDNNTGEVFKMTLSGTLTKLHSFDSLIGSSNNDGAAPSAGLLAASDGFFYGVNFDGGSSGGGTLFQITTSGVFNKLFDLCFPAVPSCFPDTTLMEHTNGSFYGLSSVGFASQGTFYRLTPLNLSEILRVAGPIFVHPGIPVEILGNNLTHVINVSFGGVQAGLQGGTDTFLIATVPMAAVDGFVTATFDSGLQIQTQSAEHILPLITNLDPTSGPVGTPVGIVGGGLAGATKVTFGGKKATQFTVVNPTLIQAIVPTRAKTGKVVVTTPNGTAKSKQTFTVT